MIDINPEIFREYDIRGIVDKDLKPESVYILGLAAGVYFKEHDETKVLIGRDNRLSSNRIRDNLVAGLTATGCSVVDIGIVITPLFYYSRVLYNINAGIMITASHNPAEFNGFKVALGPATIHGEEIQKIYKLAAEISSTWSITVKPIDSSRVECKNSVDDYLKMLNEKLKLGDKKLKVAIDCGNGTAGLFAERFLNNLGCEVIPLFCDSDGSFPHHHPDPVSSANLQILKKVALENKADLGIGFDGDGDRLGVIDNEGNIIWGDQLMILYWREILPQYPGADCIVEVKCSQALVEEIERLGGKPVMYKTGHSLIKAKMKELGAVFTGEMSGHMFFADEYFGFDDAFYAAGRLLRILSNSKQSLHEMLTDVPKYFSTAETRAPCLDQDKFEVVQLLRDSFKKTNQVVDIDGAKVFFDGGWGLVRASNTQPVIVARCEGQTKEDLEYISGTIKEALESFPQVEQFEWEY